MPSINKETFESLYRSQIAELYDAEHQMIEDMPRMIRAASSKELRNAFELHLAETKEQVARLEMILESMDGSRPQKFSDPMQALMANIRLVIAYQRPSPVLDATLIAAAQQVEHHEMAGYGAAGMLAGMLDHPRAAMLLQKSFKEEQETAADLGEIGESVVMGEELEDAVLEEPVSA